MQLMSLNKGLKPLTIAAGLLVSSNMLMYADIDQYSDVTSVVTNHRAAEYIREVDNTEGMILIAKRNFNTYFHAWKEQTYFFSSVQDIIEQKDFKAIVAMGRKAVPFILDELEREPSNLVWALNLIYERKITNNPNVTISQACKLWINALKKK